MHVLDMPLARPLNAEGFSTLHTPHQSVRHEVVDSTHVIRVRSRRWKFHIAACASADNSNSNVNNVIYD